MNIFLDDIRNPVDTFNYTKDSDYLKLKWTIVRNYDEFVKVVTENKNDINTISFDHDLADEHYINSNPGSYTEKTGYDCLKWLCYYIMGENLDIPLIKIHTWNPTGFDNMSGFLRNFYKIYKQK